MSWLAPINPQSHPQSQSQYGPNLSQAQPSRSAPSSASQSQSQSQPDNDFSGTRRIHTVIRLNPQDYAAYKASHAKVWPDVVAQIRASNIRDYSIAYDRDTSLLFASFKYTGRDFEGDMAKMRAHEPTRRWWAMTDGFQQSLNAGAVSSEKAGTAGADGKKVPSWWKECEEVFYLA
ncbi:hypothetical protein A1O7_00101 [Cladophialophora yegresii CBS 114405]|uniref:DUF718 domain-containing protein n=1 Tax=Cladophialophora yegresii CBS 114405 TaxID=1182544 RepID=W9WGQ8_9EURO|nr:uncharacterized protein A1O7_00101 [Cladophialophora yegresii CBS 114405]EXJ63766.1 hypothetical protein A1O7_00101 [Cladophialophora yegresii CBS 114405]